METILHVWLIPSNLCSLLSNVFWWILSLLFEALICPHLCFSTSHLLLNLQNLCFILYLLSFLMNSIFAWSPVSLSFFFYFLSPDISGTSWRRRNFCRITFTWLTFSWCFVISVNISSSFSQPILRLMLKRANTLKPFIIVFINLLSPFLFLICCYKTRPEHHWTGSCILLLLLSISQKTQDPQFQ